MQNDGALGCLGAIFIAALAGWVPLHFSGKSILYGRTEKAMKDGYFDTTLVTCHYFTSTGTEDTSRMVGSPSGYYCPRIKDVGN